jgi:hypothetical protein
LLAQLAFLDRWLDFWLTGSHCGLGIALPRRWPRVQKLEHTHTHTPTHTHTLYIYIFCESAQSLNKCSVAAC